MRCDYANLAGLSFNAVFFTSGAPVNTSVPATVISAAVLRANAAGIGLCLAARRALAGAGARALQARALQASTALYASFNLQIGASTTASGASAIAAAVQSSTATFPNTLTAWAPVWGFTPTTWISNGYGQPAATTGNVVINNFASYSPAPVVVLTVQQQLGIGLGVGLTLALIVAAVTVLACFTITRVTTHASTQLRVVAAAK